MRLPKLFPFACRRWFSPKPAPTLGPKGPSRRALYLLALVQGGERFAFLGLLPLFVLYLQQCHGLTERAALLTFGLFQALSYLGAWPAGLLADRALGHMPATLLGCVLLMLGYGALALDRPALLWPALGVMVLGHNFFKPGVSALASSLSASNDTHREYAFLLLHLAVNVGGVAGPLCAERSRAGAGWPGFFRWATAGMLLTTVLLAVGISLLTYRRPIRKQATSAPDLLGTQRERLRAVWQLCGVTLIFWLTAQQAGSSLPLFAEQHTIRALHLGARPWAIGPGHFASLHSLLVLLLGPLLLIAIARQQHGTSKRSIPVMMISGYVATAAAFVVMVAACHTNGEANRVSAGWLGGCYLLLSVAEVLLAPLGLSLVTRLAPPAQISQSVGLWFGAVALGSGLAGVFGLLWERWPMLHGHARYFAILVALSLSAGTLLRSRLRHLERLLA